MLATITSRLAKILCINENQVKNTVKLFDEGATVPFVARYRKEITGGLDDNQLRELNSQLNYLRELDSRRDTIIKSISEQGKLTPELEQQIYQADNKTTLEDIYLPYKPKRRTKAQIAREAGLEALAFLILDNQNSEVEKLAKDYINPEKNIHDIKSALDGARHILIEHFAENADLLALIRKKLNQEAIIVSTVIPNMAEQGEKFKDYFNYSEAINNIPSHRVLAIIRGFNEGVLSIKISYSSIDDLVNPYEKIIATYFNINLQQNIWLATTVKLCFKAKIFLSLENEILSNLRENADNEAINVFAKNLFNLLLQAPAGNKITIGLDPGVRTGVKVAVIDNTGKVINHTTVYPFQPQNKYEESIKIITQLIKLHQVELIAIGNGTYSRETEKMIQDLINANPKLNINKVIVSEAGASVYSASEYASLELPDLDVSIRGAVSIARRLQDPLAELVKIEPKSIGVGQYQHDVNQNKLAKSLDNVVEDCVNTVGVDINTASIPLLSKVAGLNKQIATNIVEYRNQNGRFTNRKQLIKISRLGEKTFEQCAGFLRIHDGDNPLDNSAVHPESYFIVENISKKLNIPLDKLINNKEVLNKIDPKNFITNDKGIETIKDIIKELEKPGRDPRGEFKMAKFDDKISTINDLKVGISLEGIITNVTNFGAFVDIGVHQDGLIHISELTNKFIKDPNVVVKIGQIVKVHVIEVDIKRKRIALSMKSTTISQNKPSTKLVNNNHQGALANAFAKLKSS